MKISYSLDQRRTLARLLYEVIPWEENIRFSPRTFDDLYSKVSNDAKTFGILFVDRIIFANMLNSFCREETRLPRVVKNIFNGSNCYCKVRE